MKKETYSCDRCGKVWDLESNAEAYVLRHLSLSGGAIMGDNRIGDALHFCRNCFSGFYPILVNKNP